MSKINRQWPPNIEAIESWLLSDHRANEATLLANVISTLDQSDFDHEKTFVGDLINSLQPKAHWIQDLLVAYDLTTEEGLSLMCMAEALMRLPDKSTRDALLQDGIQCKQWVEHSSPGWINQSLAWGLWFTDKMMPSLQQHDLLSLIKRLTMPVVRTVTELMMSKLSKHFVVGQSIEEAVGRYDAAGAYQMSYDCLGEAAITFEDSARYFESYANAIQVLKKYAKSKQLMSNPGISIKLSALYPRYEAMHHEAAIAALSQSVIQLALAAKEANIAVTLDAEEADRLNMMLMVFFNVYRDPQLQGWGGLGLAVQAYQKRSMKVLSALIEVARCHQTPIPIRLVKGAYWDSEIKWSQQRSQGNYPVWTHKSHVDVVYRACVQQLMSALDVVYPQFATHNLIDIGHLLYRYGRDHEGRYEYQCLQGMGQMVYDPLLTQYPTLKVRNYAPVGPFNELLPYLVRRMLENGANNSFLYQWEQGRSDGWQHPVDKVLITSPEQHKRIPPPVDMYPQWQNSHAPDIDLVTTQKNIIQSLSSLSQPIIDHRVGTDHGKPSIEVYNPTDHSLVGRITATPVSSLTLHVSEALQAYNDWHIKPLKERSMVLLQLADHLESSYDMCLSLLIREAGKTWADAIAEVREAVDFLRYYAHQATNNLVEVTLPGPVGEHNTLRYIGRGVMVAISPWNFPMAIYLGQIAAAVVAGNTVLAKPAEQTPLIAHQLLHWWHQCGLPKGVVQNIYGGVDVAKALVASANVSGILFTGSTQTAQSISEAMVKQSGPIRPLIAETGGMNVMWVDSTALIEQVVVDIMTSGFQSAGQRCSALRVCLVEEGIADRLIQVLAQAMNTWSVGDPANPTTDVGPIIDAEAKGRLEEHWQWLSEHAKVHARMSLPSLPGCFFPPSLVEIDDLALLSKEVFGPIVHVKRFKWSQVQQDIKAVNAWGYGLTMGIHSRLNHRIDALVNGVKAGNYYINRDMIGATVGVQPFGGIGLSGTGPKAGGPNYLKRLCHEVTVTNNTAATGGNAALIQLLE